MKKLFIISTAMLIGFFAFAQSKTTSPVCEQNTIKSAKATWDEVGSFFNLTDIDGNTHDLAAYLDAGKTVILDFSAVWCTYCWDLHQSGVFDDLHNSYGPAGTDELVVLWIECDDGTLDQINGIGGIGSGTYGDWTEGGTWPVPIIMNDGSMTSAYSLYEGYLPTVFMVCPSGYYKDVTNQAWTSAASVYAQIGSCPIAGQAPIDVEIEGPIWASLGENVDFTATFASVEEVTYEWSFENATPSTSELATTTVVYDEVGTYNIYVTITNAIGSATASHSITIEDCSVPITSFPYYESFETGLGCWTTIDASNDSYTWTDQIIGTFYAHTGDGLVASPSYTATSGALSPDNWLISPPIQLGTGSSVSFWRAAQDGAYPGEHYGVYISTTGTATSDFTLLYEETVTASGTKAQGTWRQRNVDLSSYTGSVYLAWRHFNCYDKFWLNIDDITINSTITSINNSNSNLVNVFPNPATDLITVTNATNANITIMNIVGEIVKIIDNASANQTIDMSNLSNGTYFVKVNQEVFKINISR
ncbi:MAG: choice-of-anchor J domain-containing protein [Bacteroidales bacterium]|nr:choice-of-anchor J domain-containing protein [Bacteroidales bacterium]